MTTGTHVPLANVPILYLPIPIVVVPPAQVRPLLPRISRRCALGKGGMGVRRLGTEGGTGIVVSMRVEMGHVSVGQASEWSSRRISIIGMYRCLSELGLGISGLGMSGMGTGTG